MRYNNISFPGIGIEPFHVDKAAFSILGIEVAWYGLLITCGMILAVLYALWMGKKKEGIKNDDVLDLAIFLVIFGVLGARLFYVIFEWDQFAVTSGTAWKNILGTLKSIVNLRSGGLAIFGGIIGGLLTAFCVAKYKKIPFLKFFDLLAPCVLIGQIIGRWGNFINIEVYGAETDTLFRMGLHYMDAAGNVIRETFVHPLFLYESVWNFAGLILIHCLFVRKKFDGQLFCTYMIWYGFGRMLLEGLRAPEYNLMVGSLKVSQLVGLTALVLGIVLMVVFAVKSRKKTEEENTTEEDDGASTLFN